MEFPAVIDSTLLAAIKACETKASRMYLEHWKPQEESIHLVAGAAFASGLEETRRRYWEAGFSPADSLAYGLQLLMERYGSAIAPDHGSGSAKTLDRVAGALEFYFEQFPLEQPESMNPQKDGVPHLLHEGKRAIEFSFAEPLPINHPETGDPLIYCGRADMIAEYADGLYVWDDKTSTQLGQSWTQQWDLRSQFTAYTWAARRLGFPVKGVIANGIAILKTQYNSARAITHRADFEIARWLDSTILVLERFIDSWRRGKYVMNLDDTCASYGGCSLRTVCKGENPEEWLPLYFVKRKWDPLTRTETPL